jgi:hypothetical protein
MSTGCAKCDGPGCLDSFRGRNKLKAGSWLLVSPFPEIEFILSCCCGAVKLVDSRRPVGKMGETHGVFPGLSIGDRACAVRRGSAQPTVHKFTAPLQHGVKRPVPSPPSIGRGKPRPAFASRAPDADAADYTSRRTRQDCASVRCRWPLGAGRPIRVSRSTTSRSTKMLSWQRPRPSMLISIP